MRPFRRFRSCLSAACYTYSDGVFVETALKAMLLSLGRVFLAKQEACRPWGKGRFGSGEKRRCYTNQAQSHDSERKTLEVIQQQNSLRRRLFEYPYQILLWLYKRFRNESVAVNEFQRRHHMQCSFLVLPEVRRLNMMFVGLLICIDFENGKSGRVLFFLHAVQDGNAGFAFH